MSGLNSERSPRQWLGLYPEWWILVLGVALSSVTFRYVRAEDQRNSKMRLQRRSEIVMGILSTQLNAQVDALSSLQSVFDFTREDDLTPTRFAALAEDLKRRQPTLWNLQWAERVEANEKAAFLARLNSRGESIKDFTMRGPGDGLVPDPQRSVYYPVVDTYPRRPNEANFVGFDLMGSPFLDLLAPAVSRGNVELSSIIPLVKDEPTGTALGFFAVAAVYDGPPVDLTPAQKLAQLRGYLVAVYRVDDLFGSVTEPLKENNLDLMVADRTVRDKPKTVYYRSVDGSAFPGRDVFIRNSTASTTLVVGDRFFEFRFRNAAAPTVGGTSRDAWLFLLGGLTLSAGAFAFVRLSRTHESEIAREVTERTRELEESRAQLADVMRSLPGVAYRCVYDEKMTVAFVSNAAEALTGYSAEAFRAGAVHFRDIIHPEDLRKVREATWNAINASKTYEVEYRLQTRTGAEKWVLSRGHGVRSGAVQMIEGLLTDITFQKSAERERLAIERKLLDGQKLESLGLLAGGVAHDFNNLLTVIVGSAELARMALNEGTTGVDEQLTQIDSTAQRAAELCRQMLAYAGQGRFEIAPIDLGSVVQEMQPLFNVSVHRRTHLTFRFAPGLPAVMADKTQLRQIAMNLVINASDAIEGRDGDIEVTTGLMTADRAFLASCVVGADLPPGIFVYLEVTDSGSGMTPEVIKKIFDPFFTTKFAGRGLGLAAVLGIVRGHGGGLRLQSELGTGSSFRLLLPPAGVQAKPAERPATTDRWVAQGRILLADDEDPVRKVTTKILETFGFTVDAVGDGSAAVDAFRKEPSRYAAVILDLVMPVMAGDEALREIWVTQPTTKVLLISGYNEGDLLAKNPGPMLYLRKPFTRAEIEGAMKRLLSQT